MRVAVICAVLVAGCSGASSSGASSSGATTVGSGAVPDSQVNASMTGTPSRPAGPVEDPNLLTEMEDWAERACACEDYACFVVEMDLANNLRTLRVDWWTEQQRERGIAARTKASDCGFDNFASDAGWPDADAARAAYREAIVAEDLALLRRLYDAARIYWVDHGKTAAEPSAGPTPALGTCCGYADGMCPGDDGLWAAEPWSSINANMGTAHRFSFEYEVDKKGRGFTVRGYGDLDCDGEYSTYELRGRSKKSGPGAFPKWRVKNEGE